MAFQVFLDGAPLDVLEAPVYPAPYNEKQSQAYVICGVSSPSTLLVRTDADTANALVRPLRLGLTPKAVPGGLELELPGAVNFSLELGEGTENTLLVFAAPKKELPVSAGDGRVIRFPKGKHTAGLMEICEDNVTVCLEEGAIVTGKLQVHDCRGFRLLGTGVLTESPYDVQDEPEMKHCVHLVNCRDARIEDVTLTESLRWTLRITGCDNVTVRNVKILGYRGNNDGVDVCGSRDILTENCFIRTWDDSLVVKAFDTGDLERVTFRGCTLWNDFARPIEVGVELRAEHVRDVLFEDIDVIHSCTGYPVMGIHHGDRALVSGITFRNVRIEDTPGAQLFDVRITNSVWNKDQRMGRIEGVTFENVRLVGKPGVEYLPERSRLQGYDETHTVRGVTFRGLNYLGKTVSSAEEAGVNVMDFVEDVSFEPAKGLAPVGHLKTSLIWENALTRQPDGGVRGKLRVLAENVGTVPAQAKLWLAVSPKNTAAYEGKKHPTSLLPGERAEFFEELRLPAGKFVLRVQGDSVCADGTWELVNVPAELGKTPTRFAFTNYYGDELPGLELALENDTLYLNGGEAGQTLTVYTAMPVPEEAGEVKFTCEETDFGQAPAVLLGRHGYELAPQLRCPAEITYVFKNEPKVSRICRNEVPAGERTGLSFEALGLEPGTKEFWLEVELKSEKLAGYRYPCTLFRSVVPDKMAHMFAQVRVL